MGVRNLGPWARGVSIHSGSLERFAPSASCSLLCRSWASFWQVRTWGSQLCKVATKSGPIPLDPTPGVSHSPPPALGPTPTLCFPPCSLIPEDTPSPLSPALWWGLLYLVPPLENVSWGDSAPGRGGGCRGGVVGIPEHRAEFPVGKESKSQTGRGL